MTWLKEWLFELWNCLFKNRLYGDFRVRELRRMSSHQSHPYNK